jgi:hypothetical protein
MSSKATYAVRHHPFHGWSVWFNGELSKANFVSEAAARAHMQSLLNNAAMRR